MQFDQAGVDEVPANKLPKDWRAYPPPGKLQEIGDAWITKLAKPILRVPSAIVPAESIYLLNPAHPDFGGIVISEPVPYRFDARFGWGGL